MDIDYRHARLDDVSAVSTVWADAVNALNQRHGFGNSPLNPVPPNPYYAFALTEEPDGFWVAEDAGEIIGYALSWVRHSLWFLGMLFVHSAHQGKGVGRHLLDLALAYGSQARITNRGLITFAYNPTSISLYMRYGMYPREALYAMRGASATVRSGEAVAVDHDRADASPESVEMLSQIDGQVLGFAREQHHRYLLSTPGASCHLFRSGGAVLGYAYVWAGGRIGPLAVTSHSRFALVLNAALGLATTDNTDSVSIIVAGSNEQGLAIALGRGMRIASPFVLMSTKPFGNWGSYLFHSPGLL
jgi:ribosomal protein S18 acetylase RimI-like enzyme